MDQQATSHRVADRKRPGELARDAGSHVSRQSFFGLNAANFFLAEITGVVMPFLGDYLKGRQWSESALGVAISLAGLGVFLMQTPAGIDCRPACGGGGRCWPGPRCCWAFVMGWCRWCRPVLAGSIRCCLLAGAAQAFFLPLLGALALGLVGHAALNRTIGSNQGWNHAGNLAAALLAMSLVGWFAVSSIFFAVAVVSVLAAGIGLFDPRGRDRRSAGQRRRRRWRRQGAGSGHCCATTACGCCWCRPHCFIWPTRR